MLILTRRTGEAIRIGDKIRIVVVQAEAGKIRIGIEGPRELPILREELYTLIREGNQQANAPADLALEHWLTEGKKETP